MKKFLPLLISIAIFAVVAVFFLSKKDEMLDLDSTAQKIERPAKKDSLHRNFDDSKPSQVVQKETIKRPARKEGKLSRTEKLANQKKKIQSQSKKFISKILEQTYAPFFKEIGLSPERQVELSNFLQKNQESLQKVLLDLMGGKLTDEEIANSQQALREQQDTKLNNILNSGEQERLENFHKNLPVETTKKIMTALYINKDGSNLTEENQKIVAKAFINNSHRITGMPKSGRVPSGKTPINSENIDEWREFTNRTQENMRNPKNTKNQQKLILNATAEELKEKGINIKPRNS